MDGPLIERKNDDLTVPGDRLSPNLLTAIFDQLSGNLETIERMKTGAFIVSIDDLDDIYHRLEQMTSQYRLKGLNCQFVISVEEGGVYRFSSFNKLKESNLKALSKAVSAVSIQCDLLIGSPLDEAEHDSGAQRFKISATIEDPLRVMERQGDLSFLSLRLRQPEVRTAGIRIEHSDYAVGRSLLSVVEEWLEGLKTDQEGTINSRWRKRLAKSSSASVGLLPICIIAGSIIFEPANYPNIFTPYRYLAMVILLAILAIVLAVFADERITKLLALLSPRTRFELSGGDRKFGEKLCRRRKKAYRNLWIAFVGIFLTAAVGLFVNYLSSLFFSAQPLAVG
ncbi:hypothetical protein [Parasphingorhabdus flavimaris]|uniref:hypothetical protein n=1 Tax=Parasphingorhabdus flavimaris TaxID=266812 RepID=UPI0030026C40